MVIILLAIILLVILFVRFINWCSEDSPKNRAQREKDEIWVKKYGHTEEEITAIIRTSPIVDKVVNIIVEESYPQAVHIYNDRITLSDVKNSFMKTKYFKEFGCSNLPLTIRIQAEFAEALKAKLPPFYELRERDYEYWLQRKNEEKKENCTFKGW